MVFFYFIVFYSTIKGIPKLLTPKMFPLFFTRQPVRRTFWSEQNIANRPAGVLAKLFFKLNLVLNLYSKCSFKFESKPFQPQYTKILLFDYIHVFGCLKFSSSSKVVQVLHIGLSFPNKRTPSFLVITINRPDHEEGCCMQWRFLVAPFHWHRVTFILLFQHRTLLPCFRST